MNRQQKRQSERNGKKMMNSKPFEYLPVSLDGAPSGCTRIFRNHKYFVFIYDQVPTTKGEAVKAMIRQHDNQPIKNHWSELQKVKNHFFGDEAVAVEYFPPQSKLIDDANLYWIWLFPDGVLPKPLL